MNLSNDLKYNLNLLKKNLGFTLLCVSVITIGMALILPMYTLLDNAALKSPPIPYGKQYVSFYKIYNDPTLGTEHFTAFDPFHYDYFKRNASSFQTLEVWRDGIKSISDGNIAEAYPSAEITATLLQAAGRPALLGRLFSVDDNLPDAEPVAIISYSIWQNYYAGRQDIIGHQSRINSVLRTVVGVMPEGFKFPWSQELWLPLEQINSLAPGSQAEDLIMVGRLADGVKLNQARNEILTMQTQIKNLWPDEYKHINRTLVAPYIAMGGAFLGPIAYLLLIIAVCIVLLVTFNIGNLFLTRGEERLHELAIRSALGGAPKKVISALMQESLLICIFGFLVGLPLSSLVASIINKQVINNTPQLSNVLWWNMSLSPGLIFISIVTVLLIWAFSGGISAWQISRYDLTEFLNDTGKGVSNVSATKLGKVMVNIQLIFGCILLSVGLSFVLLLPTVSPADDLIISNKYMSEIKFSQASLPTPGNTETAQQEYQDVLRQSLLNQPGVDDVTFATSIAGNSAPRTTYNIPTRDLEFNDEYPVAYSVAVANDYFNFFDINLIAGRSFATEDSLGSLPVAIIDQTLAETLWPNQTAVGKRIQVNAQNNGKVLTIVGISRYISQNGTNLDDLQVDSIIYQPLLQMPITDFSVVFSTINNTIDFKQVLQTATTQTNQDIPVVAIQSLQDREDMIMTLGNSSRNLYLSVMLIAMYISAIATYGLTARSVAQRRVETGIRMALGADKLAAIMMFLKSGLTTVMIGLIVGGILAVSFSYFFLTILSTTGSYLIIFPLALSICLGMGAMVMLASYIPARKIVAMEPGEALRYE